MKREKTIYYMSNNKDRILVLYADGRKKSVVLVRFNMEWHLEWHPLPVSIIVDEATATKSGWRAGQQITRQEMFEFFFQKLME